MADRYHLLAGSAFETDLGSGYDLVLIANFLHHFDSPTCTDFHAQSAYYAKARRSRRNC